jgi:hypothetical protein
MHSIDFPTLLTIMYVLVDDWYKENAPRLLQGKVGAKPVFSDSELITLMLAIAFLSFESETQFLAFMRANYLQLFPRLCDQSQSKSPLSLLAFAGRATSSHMARRVETAR